MAAFSPALILTKAKNSHLLSSNTLLEVSSSCFIDKPINLYPYCHRKLLLH